VLGGVRRVVLAAIVAGAALYVPAAAFACDGGGPSAVNVYKECLPTGGGAKATSGGSESSASSMLQVSPQTARALARASKRNRALLSALVRDPSLGAPSHLKEVGGTSAAEPTALGSAVDLGSGPTALLVVLAATALLLLGVSGTRAWRHRQH